MNNINILKDKLLNRHLYDCSLISFKILEYHRDYELYLDLITYKIKILLKGVVSMNYTSKVKKDGFIMKDEYIRDVQPYPLEAYYWGIKSFGIDNWEIIEDSQDVIELQKDYNFKLYKLKFDVNSCYISFIFHDLEIEEIKE